MTASRKARVFDVRVEQAYAMLKRKEKPPEHLANSIYLEWFSETNGRVVIESADYQVTISPPEWQLTREENEQRAREARPSHDSIRWKSSPTPSNDISAVKKTPKNSGTSTITNAS